MSFSKISAIAGLVVLASKISAHGTATGIVADGVYYVGYQANYQYMATQPVVVGWSTPEDTDNGFIAPDAYATSDIICHKGATNAQTSATVKAGGSVEIQWTAWPSSHHGPVIDYLADCGGDCTTVDKTTLEFFKIDGVGLLDDTTIPGNWASDELIANNNSWTVTIPSTIAPGNYVLRHEIIALHSAENADGAQNYPQCFNLEVTGSGTDSPSGTLGTALYTETDPGIEVNIYAALASYTVPGPALYSGAVSASQGVVSATAVASSVATTSAAAGVVTSSPVAQASSGSIASSVAPVVTSTPVSSSYPSVAPFSNTTVAAVSSKKTKSACKAKTSSKPVVSNASGVNQANPATSTDILTTSADAVTIATSLASTPVVTSAKATQTKASSGSGKGSGLGSGSGKASGSKTSTGSSAASTSTSSGAASSAPSGTTLGDLLSWISSFYNKYAGTEYTEATVARRHARDLAARQFDSFSSEAAAQPSGVAHASGHKHHQAHGTGAAKATGARQSGAAHASGFGGAKPTGAFSAGNAKATGHSHNGGDRPSGTFSAGSAFPTGKGAFFKHNGF